MSASKAVLGFSKSIIVDVSETAGLPDLIKNAYRTGGASIPIVIFTDPGVTKIFGRYDHPAMKSQKYGTIFKPARDGVSKAKKDGTFFSVRGSPQSSSRSRLANSKVGKVLPEPKSKLNSLLLRTKKPIFSSLKLEKRFEQLPHNSMNPASQELASWQD